MPDRLDSAILRDELQCSALHGLLVAFLDLQANRLNLIGEYRRRGADGMTYLDSVLVLHVFIFRDHGTRQQDLVESLAASRRTIRDSLDRCCRNNLIIRGKRDRLYYPTENVGEIANAQAAQAMAKIARLCDAYAEYKKRLQGG